MKRRDLPLAFIAVLLLAFGAIAAACGGGGEPLTLEEYFQRLQVLSDDFSEQGEAVDQQYEEDTAAAESEEELLEALQSFFGASRLTFVDFVDGIEDLDPPEQLEGAHNEAVEAGGDILTAFENFLDEQVEEESLVDARERFDEACFDLEEIAGENDIAVDLDCEG